MGTFAGLDFQKGKVVSDKSPSKEKSAKAADKSLESSKLPGDAAERTPPEGLRALALDYPFALLAGGLVAGVVIGSLLPRSGKLTKGAAALAGVAGELGLSYARKAVENMTDAAQSATQVGGRVVDSVSEKSGDLIDAVSGSASDYSELAAETVESAAVALRNSAEGFARQVIRLTSQLRH